MALVCGVVLLVLEMFFFLVIMLQSGNIASASQLILLSFYAANQRVDTKSMDWHNPSRFLLDLTGLF